MSIRLPRLLNENQKELARLHPSRLSLDLRLRPLSTAEMQLPATEPAVAVRDLVELYDENGSAGIFRVTSIDDQPGLKRKVYLEHGLATLSDGFIPAMTISEKLRTAVNRILGYQPYIRWQLGDVDLPEETTILFTTGHANLLTALMKLIDLLPSSLMLDFDQSGSIWTLHLRAMNDADACEGRLTRNLSSVRISTDASDLCTRVYPYGAGQGTERISLRPLLGEDYIQSDAAAVWGVISRTFTNSSIFDAATLQAVAQKYLERHGEPTVSVTANAIDLSSATGESADRFHLGRMCRLALPEMSTVLHERIVALKRTDVYGAPGLTAVTLSNRISDTADEIADMLHEVIADKTIGGRVRDVTTANRASGTSTSPVVHYFRVESGMTVLSCRALLDPDSGVSITSLRLDGTDIPRASYGSGVCDLLPYIKRTSTGAISTGRHTLSIYPSDGAVNSTVTMQVIEAV
ncbi:MAG: phage tail protein [Clostridia bacterium]|nr:phage tail protein [Clostridia bacterium]